ncbi:ketoacyl-ACP synthase III [Alteromonas sp. 5E99-2]|uniref:ketoacyl-ACP synthase III n=1 Tax=Alteromonas sp. 5E99-2 TaxID=2817683 RepID=UPI001A981710|nr:ketoacyl-ACP synthase III [Alteromonas sp. 5E99-2]MBO1256001.1 ketoacyl-ACP synthase III [Alteromonas sp. 5E99-2]
MTTTTIKNITMSGIQSVLPKHIKVNIDDTSEYQKSEKQRIVASTGIHSRRVVNKGQTALDLGLIACDNLIEKMKWQKEDIALVIFVTQTPDFAFPGNAIQLQHKLGLSKTSIAFDVNLGCSGFVYGLWQASQLLLGLSQDKALLVVGDTTSTQYSESNQTVSLLFGDAVSAIAIEKSENCDDMIFSLGSDGAGAPYLIQPNSCAKFPDQKPELFMDGMQVFAFTLREVPASMYECLNAKNWKSEELDYCIMHQANKMMLKRLGDKFGLNEKQLVIAMDAVGNTSSASIPLALCMELSNTLKVNSNKLLLSGFGVGWSWGSVTLTLPPLRVCHTIDLTD